MAVILKWDGRENRILRFARECGNRRIHLSADDGWTVKGVCDLLSVPVPEDVDAERCFSVVCSNDVITKDCLFICCKRDDPARALEAIREGALAVVTELPIDCPHRILVPDIMDAHIALFRKLFEPYNVPATVIAGSIGKTTTTQMVNLVYATQYRTYYDGITENIFESLGAQLLHFDKKAQRYVVEVSETPFFAPSAFSRTLRPQIAIITTIDKSHIHTLGGEENICKYICAIADGMDEDGYVITNLDDPKSRDTSFKPHKITVGILDKNADCIAENITTDEGTLSFDCIYKGDRTHIKLNTIGTHNVYNAMMAFVAGRLNGISCERIAMGLSKYHPQGFRQCFYQTGGRVIYADCFNASARSIHSALDVMNTLTVNGKKAAILGDIVEIEGYEKDMYQMIAKSIDESDIDILVTFGPDSRRLGTMVKKPIRMIHCTNREELDKAVKNLKKEGVQAFLFKGSRIRRLEESIKAAFPLVYYRMMIPEKAKFYFAVLCGAIPEF